MSSMITNIYNKKTKGPTLMELFAATGKLKKFFFFLTTRYVWCVHLGWHETHLYAIQVLATHASTHVHRYSSLLQWSMHRQPVSVNCLYHARTVLSAGGSFARNARCTVITDLLMWYSSTQNDFSPRAAIFSLHTLASPSGRNVNCDEKQLTGKKKIELFLPSVQVS